MQGTKNCLFYSFVIRLNFYGLSCYKIFLFVEHFQFPTRHWNKKNCPWEFFPFINRFLKKAFRFRIFGHLRVLKRLQNVFSSIIWCAATYTQVAKENLFKSFLADPNIWQNANRSVEQIELSRILHSQLILRFVFYYEWKLLTCGSQNRYNCENMKINKISWVPLKYWIELSNFFN